MKLRRWYYRASNRLLDAWARLQGCCNASTWDPIRKTYGGGYSHWRCGKEHGHPGPHRFHNYAWWYRGEPVFDPYAPNFPGPSHMDLAAHRHPIMSRGRQRLHDQEMEMLGKLRRNEIRARRDQKRLR